MPGGIKIMFDFNLYLIFSLKTPLVPDTLKEKIKI
jgi:hypothetical protein